ncbi:MAG: class I SAM-dependent methyltransferase [Acidimicrobiales bacterium]
MPPHRDVDAFDERAPTYDGGFLGRLHHDIADRTAELALSGPCAPARILDVGCGTGYLLQSLARRCPEALELAGIDAAPSMIDTARAHAGDGPLVFATGVVEHLPYDDATFDLVVSTTSFDHWSDQRAGLAECARVMVRGGTPRPRRPVLDPARTDTALRPQGQGPHAAPCVEAPGRGGFRRCAMARPLCLHHQGGHGLDVTVLRPGHRREPRHEPPCPIPLAPAPDLRRPRRRGRSGHGARRPSMAP